MSKTTATLLLGGVAVMAIRLVSEADCWHDRIASAPLPKLPKQDTVHVDQNRTTHAVTPYRAPILFTQNVGQTDLPGRYVAQFSGGAAAFSDHGFLLQFAESRERNCPMALCKAGPSHTPVTENACDGLNLQFTFEGAQPDARVIGEGRSPTHVNVYRGRDPAQWHEDIPCYSSLRCADLYPGISADFHEASGRLEYDLVLQPGAHIDQVVVRCDGAGKLTVESEGSLVMSTALGTWRLPPPTTFVERAGSCWPLECRYRSIGPSSFGFAIAGWNGDGTVVVDPGIAYATYLGGLNADVALCVAADAQGSAYVGGHGGGLGFPTTPGAFKTTGNSSSTGFLTKFTPGGSGLVYSTFLDGTSYTDIEALVITPSGEAVAACSTEDSTFPTTGGCFDPTHNGAQFSFDGIVLKLSASGGQLVFSTYLGGTADDFLYGVDIDPQGSVYVTGTTDSFDYPTTPGALRQVSTSKGEAVVTKLSADGSTLQYSTYLGNTVGDDIGHAILATSTGEAVIVGETVTGASDDFPVTPGAYDVTPNGYHDAFVARLDSSGSRVVFATYLGGEFNDAALAAAAAPDGSLYVTGTTGSGAFPVTAGAIQPFFPSSLNAAFVSHLSADGAQLLQSTFLGGPFYGAGRGIGLTPAGHVVVGGQFDTTSLLTPDAAVSATAGDCAVYKLDSALSQVLYGSFVSGPPLGELPWDLCVDAQGAAYIVGQTWGTGFPFKPDSFDTTLGGPSDAFLVKFDFSPWLDLGSTLAGTAGLAPHLAGIGTLQPGASGALELTGARPLAAATLVVGLQSIDAPFKGGTLVPAPLLLVPLATDVGGEVSLPWSTWPAGLPAGTSVFLQVWVADAGAPHGFAASNGLEAVTPVPWPGG